LTYEEDVLEGVDHGSGELRGENTLSMSPPKIIKKFVASDKSMYILSEPRIKSIVPRCHMLSTDKRNNDYCLNSLLMRRRYPFV
jgi:hypothetical protein